MLSLLTRVTSSRSLGIAPATLLVVAVAGLSLEPGRAEAARSADRMSVQLAQASSSNTSATEKDAIHAVVSGYYDAFGRDSAAASGFYGEPTLIVAPNKVIVLSTRADIEAFLDRVAANLKRNGYSHSTLIDRRVKLLTSTTALCGGIAIRMKADGTEMQRSGFTYLLQKGDLGWRIHELIPTDLDKLIDAD